MDAGLAAVCGTLAGALGTIGAAFAGGWWQRKNAELSVRAEHRKDQRQPRYDAYKAFSAACAELAELARSRDTGDAAFEVAYDLESTVKAQWVEISLLGPAYVLQPANKLRASALRIVPAMYQSERAGANEDADTEESRQRITNEVYASFAMLDQVAAETYRNLEEFAAMAQRAISDDGSRLPR